MSFAKGFASTFAPAMGRLGESWAEENKKRLENAQKTARFTRASSNATRLMGLPSSANSAVMELAETLSPDNPEEGLAKAIEMYQDPKSGLVFNDPSGPAPRVEETDISLAAQTESAFSTPTAPSAPTINQPATAQEATQTAQQPARQNLGGFSINRDNTREIEWYMDNSKINNEEEAAAAAVLARRSGNQARAQELEQMYPRSSENQLGILEARLAKDGTLPSEEMAEYRRLSRMVRGDQAVEGATMLAVDGDITQATPVEMEGGRRGYQLPDGRVVGLNEARLLSNDDLDAAATFRRNLTQRQEEVEREMSRVEQSVLHIDAISEIFLAQPDANTAVAGGASFINKVTNELGALGNLFQEYSNEDGTITQAQATAAINEFVNTNFGRDLSQLANARRQLYSRFTLLTFAMLGSEGQSGTAVSVREFNAVLATFAGSNSAEGVIDVLSGLVQDQAMVTEDRARRLIGRENPSAVRWAAERGFNPAYDVQSFTERAEEQPNPQLQSRLKRGLDLVMSANRRNLFDVRVNGTPEARQQPRPVEQPAQEGRATYKVDGALPTNIRSLIPEGANLEGFSLVIENGRITDVIDPNGNSLGGTE